MQNERERDLFPMIRGPTTASDMVLSRQEASMRLIMRPA